jgi:hypothetical protein
MSEFKLRPIEEILKPYPDQFLTPDARALVEDGDFKAFGTEEDEARAATTKRIKEMLVPYQFGLKGLFEFARNFEGLHHFPPSPYSLALVTFDPLPDYWTVISFHGSNLNHDKKDPEIDSVLICRAAKSAVRALKEAPSVSFFKRDPDITIRGVPSSIDASVIRFDNGNITRLYGGILTDAPLYYRTEPRFWVSRMTYFTYEGIARQLNTNGSEPYYYSAADKSFRRRSTDTDVLTIEEEIAYILQPIPLIDSNSQSKG